MSLKAWYYEGSFTTSCKDISQRFYISSVPSKEPVPGRRKFGVGRKMKSLWRWLMQPVSWGGGGWPSVKGRRWKGVPLAERIWGSGTISMSTRATRIFQARLLADVALMLVISTFLSFGSWAAGERGLGVDGGRETASYELFGSGMGLGSWTDWDRSKLYKFDDIKDDFRPESERDIHRWWAEQELQALSTIARRPLVSAGGGGGGVRFPATLPGGFT